MAGPLGAVKRLDVKENMLRLFYKIHPEMGTRLGKAIGVEVPTDV